MSGKVRARLHPVSKRFVGYPPRPVSMAIGMTQTSTQTFTPRGSGSQLDTFYRYASADESSWGAWRKVTAA